MKKNEPKSKLYRIVARVDEDTKQRIVRACKHIGIDESNLVRSCVEALLRNIEDQGHISLPIRLFVLEPGEEVVETSKDSKNKPTFNAEEPLVRPGDMRVFDKDAAGEPKNRINSDSPADISEHAEAAHVSRKKKA